MFGDIIKREDIDVNQEGLRMRDGESFAFVRYVIDDIASTDVKVGDYLMRFYRTVFVLWHFWKKWCPPKARSVNVPVKRMKVPLLRWFTISLFAFIRFIKTRPDTVLWTWECFFPGGLFLKIMCPRTKVFVDIRSHPISQKTRLAKTMYDALFVWTFENRRSFR